MTTQTRRAALRMLASTTLVGMPVAVATAASQAPEPDAALVDLYAEWQRLDEAYMAEVEAKESAEVELETFESLRPVADTRRTGSNAEVVASLDALTAEKKALADRLGLTAARARTQALCDAQMVIEHRIRETPPTGLLGLTIKARLAKETGCSHMRDQLVVDMLALKPEMA